MVSNRRKAVMSATKLLTFMASLSLSLNVNAFYTKNANIYDEQGNKVVMNGLSWSGFQDTNIFQGLQSNPFYAITTKKSNPRNYGLMDLVSNPWDFPGSGVDKSKGVEFKTVRIPIQPGIFYEDRAEVNLNKSYSDKNFPRAGNGIFCKSWEKNSNECAIAVSPKKAFWTAIQEMKRHNINVIIDIHHQYDYVDSWSDGTVYDINQYMADLRLIAFQVKERGLDNVIGIDIFNEPFRLNWFKTNGSQVPWTKVIAMAANTIYQVNPRLLLFVEGADNGNDTADNPVICIEKDKIVDDPNGYSHSSDKDLCGNLERVFFKGSWGEDFKPLLNQDLAKQGVVEFDREKFETELIKQGINRQALRWLLGNNKADNSHFVASPHVYPAEVVGWETAPGEPSNLRFDWTWGFLHAAGYPVVLGETSWKTRQGRAFFTKALMPYLKDNIGTNNIIFWGIGYLADTHSLINPHNGELNIDVHQTLKPYWGDVKITDKNN